MIQRRGSFVLSLDTEGAWGTFDHGGLQRYAPHFRQYRSIVARLVGLLDRYESPATWAFVGHLLLQSCDRGDDGVTHPEVMRPRYSWYPHDWHHLDPATDVHRNPWWYGSDLIEMVLGARMSHEIATHTFSHIVVDDPACTRVIFQSQLNACIALHRTWGLEVDTIVYPRNRIAFLDLLPSMGITVYRGEERRWYAGLRRPIRRTLQLSAAAVASAPPTYEIEHPVPGVPINVPASMFYLQRDGFRRRIPIATRVLQAKKGLRRAAERGEVFHLWFHPFNLGSDPALFDGLEQIYEYADALRRTGALDMLTMRDAARIHREGHSAQ